MAGREVCGFENSLATLFQGASMILTPYSFTPAEKVEELKGVLADAGFARFEVTNPARHDEMIAYTSQLAHVVSSAYVRDKLARSHVGYSAGSFQDMTRVATVDPAVWTDLMLSNRAALEATLSRLVGRLEEYRDAVAAGDASRLHALLADGRAAKLACR